MANLARYPVQPVSPFSETFDRLFRDAFAWPRLLGENGLRGGLSVSSNLYETDDAYIMQVALPGLKREQMEITAHRNILTLRGTTGVAAPEGARGVWTGLGEGEFSQQVTLPGEVDAEKATAEYTDGVLVLTLPKAERARTKTIKIGGAQPASEART